MANILTSIRIICGLLILIFPAFSAKFYLLYIIGGFTDAIDGTIARKLGTDTAFGAKYDTIADCIFAIAVMVKIVKSVNLPIILIIWVFVIFIIKIANIVMGYIRYNRLITVHSMVNKACGAVCYIAPLFISGAYASQVKTTVLIIVCVLASMAAANECLNILKGKSIE